jgi:hypothetical protein
MWTIGAIRYPADLHRVLGVELRAFAFFERLAAGLPVDDEVDVPLVADDRLDQGFPGFDVAVFASGAQNPGDELRGRFGPFGVEANDAVGRPGVPVGGVDDGRFGHQERVGGEPVLGRERQERLYVRHHVGVVVTDDTVVRPPFDDVVRA